MAPAQARASTQGHRHAKDNRNLKQFYGLTKVSARSQSSISHTAFIQKAATEITKGTHSRTRYVIWLIQSIRIPSNKRSGNIAVAVQEELMTLGNPTRDFWMRRGMNCQEFIAIVVEFRMRY
jgi:hypothetical protein